MCNIDPDPSIEKVDYFIYFDVFDIYCFNT